jgi:hypothetical protein
MLLGRSRTLTFCLGKKATAPKIIQHQRALLFGLVVVLRAFVTIVSEGRRTSGAVPARARGVARVPGPSSTTKQHPKDEGEYDDTHSPGQD